MTFEDRIIKYHWINDQSDDTGRVFREIVQALRHDLAGHRESLRPAGTHTRAYQDGQILGLSRALYLLTEREELKS